MIPVRFAHVAFRVPDVERSLAFYCGVLGFREAFRVHRDDGSLAMVYVQFGPEQFVELFPAAGGLSSSEDAAAPPAGGLTGYEHLCLHVDDSDATLAELRGRGLEVGAPRTGTSGARVYFLQDPDGNQIELAELGPQTQSRQAHARATWQAWLRERTSGAQ